MDLLDLAQSDLAANRRGYLSPAQKAKLTRKLMEIGFGYGFVAAFFVAFFVYSLRDTTQGDKGALLSAFGTGIGAVVLIGVTIHKCSQIQQDLAKGKALSVDGKVALRVMETRTLRYKLQIGHVELEIPKRAFQELKDGKKYRVYYTPKSRTIIGIEHIH